MTPLRLVSLLLAFSYAGCASSEFSQQGDYHVISFRMSEAKIPVVRGKLNDKDAWFIIDTGASATLINKAVAKYFGVLERFNLDGGRTEISGLGGSVMFESSFCKIGIGNLVIHHPALKSKGLNSLFTLMSERENIPITGILGADILSRYGMSVNYESKTLSYKIKRVIDAVVAN